MSAATAVAAASAGLLAAMTAAAMPVLLLWLYSSTRRSFELMPGGLSSSARPLPGKQGAPLTHVLHSSRALYRVPAHICLVNQYLPRLQCKITV